MRSTKESKCFPYALSQVCYIELFSDGTLGQIPCHKSAIEQAYKRAINKESTIYAVWPGSYRSDLFCIDDLNELADAYGIERDDPHIHEIEWKFSSMDDKISRYAYIDIKFKCGCKIEDGTIKKLALDLRKQLGWEVATSVGWSGYDGKYTIKVLRTSIKAV